MTVRALAAAAALCLVVPGVQAAIEYLPEADVLWVSDYPEAFPCTPELLARVDAARGWGKVAYDAEKETCTVACGLVIGRNDGSDTWFQVGSPARPRETLIVRGDLRVHSTWLLGQNSGEWRSGRGSTNRLTLGVHDEPGINARLLIDNEERAGHSIVIGGFSGYGSENQGGDLCGYHSTIAPAGEVPIGARTGGSRPIYLGGKGVLELVGCTVRGVASVAFGANLTDGVFEATRFENCGTAIHGTYQEFVRGCSFVNCGTAVVSGSRNVLRLTECTFEGNERNWVVQYLHAIAIDCRVDDFDRGSYAAERETFLVSKRHIIVRVVDEQGQPVQGAQVRASTVADIAAPEFDLLQAATGADGLTPGPDSGGALLLSELLIEAPQEQAGEPVRTDYVWSVEATAGGRVGRVEGFTPRESWQQVKIAIAAH